MNVREEIDRATPVVDRLNAAIRDNPLAAGLIGAGVAWMLFGGRKGLGMMANMGATVAAQTGAAASTASGAVGNAFAKAGAQAAAAGSKTAAAVKHAASVVESVASIVPDMPLTDTNEVRTARSYAESAVTDGAAVINQGRQYAATVQSKLSETLEQQPLLLGAIGFMIGAGIASTFASSSVEGEWMGKQSEALRDQLQDIAGDVKDRAGEVVSAVTEEADRQGLTADRAKAAISDVSEKAKAVVGAGGNSIQQRF